MAADWFINGIIADFMAQTGTEYGHQYSLSLNRIGWRGRQVRPGACAVVKNVYGCVIAVRLTEVAPKSGKVNTRSGLEVITLFSS